MSEKKAKEFDLDAASSALDLALETADDEAPTTKAEKVKALKPKILALKAKGKTWDDIAALLGGISKDTLRKAIGSSKPVVKKPRKKRSVTSSPVAKKATTGDESGSAVDGNVQKPGAKPTGTGGHGAKYDLGG